MSHDSQFEPVGRVDRSRPIAFTFDGKALSGFRGDTLASALLRNGIHLVARSFKYHRPRGILAAGSEEPNALVAVRRDDARYTPNLRATQVEIYEGLEAHSQNRWPSLRLDFGAINGLLSPLIPAGFYYKTFMWPRGAWKSLYEPRIREAAGLGKSPTQADPDRYTHRFAHCDVLVVGGGPAGLKAALAAASAGARVVICDEQLEFGGSLLYEPAGEHTAVIDGMSAPKWLARAVETLTRNPRVIALPRTTAFGYFPHNMVGLNQRLTDHLARPHPDMPRERQWQVRAKEVVLASGAIERPLVFPGNDRPGIMLAGAARTYINRYGAVPGSRAVVVTACNEAYRAALDLHSAGVYIALIADVRHEVDGQWVSFARQAGIPIQTLATVVGTSGRLRVESVQLAHVDKQGNVTDDSVITIPCDLVLMSGGFTPAVHLFSQSRGKLVWDEKTKSFIPGSPAERARSAGACRGVFSLEAVLADGARAGADAAADAHAAITPAPNSPRAPSSAFADPPIGAFLGALPQPGGSTGTMAFVDWQNDVTTQDLVLAAREGFRSIEHVKRYTTTGMATDQGKTSNLNTLAVVAASSISPSRKWDSPLSACRTRL